MFEHNFETPHFAVVVTAAVAEAHPFEFLLQRVIQLIRIL